MSLKSIERAIEEELTGKELWGDIDFSIDDYEGIKYRISDILENPRYDITFIYEKYPVALTTFLVFLIRYKYNINFWGLVASELGISVNGNIESAIGYYTRKVLKKYKFVSILLK